MHHVGEQDDIVALRNRVREEVSRYNPHPPRNWVSGQFLPRYRSRRRQLKQRRFQLAVLPQHRNQPRPRTATKIQQPTMGAEIIGDRQRLGGLGLYRLHSFRDDPLFVCRKLPFAELSLTAANSLLQFHPAWV